MLKFWQRFAVVLSMLLTCAPLAIAGPRTRASLFLVGSVGPASSVKWTSKTDFFADSDRKPSGDLPLEIGRFLRFSNTELGFAVFLSSANRGRLSGVAPYELYLDSQKLPLDRGTVRLVQSGSGAGREEHSLKLKLLSGGSSFSGNQLHDTLTLSVVAP